MTRSQEHAFAQYVRILGKGKNTSRSLTREEAFAAFTHVLKQEVEDIQLGAFLLLLRVKGEDENEMAGFAEAAQQFINAPALAVDIDWPSYAGKHKQDPWYLLSALLLAANDHKILMHGSTYQNRTRIYSAQVLRELQIPLCDSWQDVDTQLHSSNFAYAPLNLLSRPLDQLFSYRSLLGVRSPVNSLIKLVNPLRAATTLQSVFHPDYLEIHQQAALLLGHTHSLVLKGEGGEIEFRPDAENRLFLLDRGVCSVEKWHRTQPARQTSLDLDVEGSSKMAAARLKAVWDGSVVDDYGLNAILGTTAMVLSARRLAESEAEARRQARDYWQNRNKQFFH